MQNQASPAVSIGPVLFYWPKATLQAFYQQVAQSDAAVVYLGETVCSKRREFGFDDYLHSAHLLKEAGKQVVLSTLTLIETNADLRDLRRLTDNGEFMLEANDVGAIAWLQQHKLPFVAGAAISVYNEQTLQLLYNQGMRRWVMPVELSRDWLQSLLSQPALDAIRGKFDIEVFAYGHLPLAWSGRCFTARSENRHKDQCELCCGKYPAGRLSQSQEGQPLFVLNGIQTLSGAKYNLQNALASMQGLVHYVRLSPDQDNFLHKISQFARPHGVGTAPAALPVGHVDGYWHRLAGFCRQPQQAE